MNTSVSSESGVFLRSFFHHGVEYASQLITSCCDLIAAIVRHGMPSRTQEPPTDSNWELSWGIQPLKTISEAHGTKRRLFDTAFICHYITSVYDG